MTTTSIFTGKIFVISSTEPNSHQLKRLIIKHRGHVTLSLSRKVHFFVQSYLNEDDDRLGKVRDLQIQVVPSLYVIDSCAANRLLDTKDHAFGLKPWQTVKDDSHRISFFALFRSVPEEHWREREEQPQCFQEFVDMPDRLVPGEESRGRLINILPLVLATETTGTTQLLTPNFSCFVQNLSDYLGIFFNLATSVLPRKYLAYKTSPPNKYICNLDKGRSCQIKSTSTGKLYVLDLIDKLTENLLHEDGCCIIAVTDVELIESGANSSPIYGRATGDGGCVITLHPGSSTTSAKAEMPFWEQKFLLSVASHELCHCFGLDHCAYFGCLMNAACDRDVEISGGNPPVFLCPICLRKAHYVFNFNVRQRYQQLGNLFLKLDCKKEMQFIESVVKYFEK